MAKKIFEWNSSKGPWMGGEFKRKNEEGLTLLYKTIGPGHELFEKWREPLCREWGLDPDVDPQIILDRVFDLDCWEWAGPYVLALVSISLNHRSNY
jgi:hypothetical protein